MYIYSCYNCLVVFILIIDLENVGVDTFIISLSFITSEILKKVYCSLMAVTNLQSVIHMFYYYFLMVFIVHLDNENIRIIMHTFEDIE